MGVHPTQRRVDVRRALIDPLLADLIHKTGDRRDVRLVEATELRLDDAEVMVCPRGDW
ncbi:hypothetical protein [Micromonospora sp. NPDC023814]|uniref:hypothetical protein n=1 Tax=Micromonospora sp. NPDC023814 TaxID=3154596 RepID=UPI0033D4887E